MEPDGRISIVTPWQHNGTAREFLRGKSSKIKINVVRTSAADEDSQLMRMIKMTGACIGLRYLHSKDIVHADFRGVSFSLN
jgi:hypothetical protein